MKSNSTFFVLISLMIVLIFSISFFTLAQQNAEVADAKSIAEQNTKSAKESLIATAKADAERDVKVDFGNNEKLLWFSAGFGCCVFGVMAAHLGKAQTPPVRLLGKSPEYVEIYMHTYEDKLHENRMIFAGTGCVLSLGLLAALILTDNSSDVSLDDPVADNSSDASLDDAVSDCLNLIDLLDAGCSCLFQFLEEVE